MIDDVHLQPLVDAAPMRRFRKGALLIQEGDTGTTMFVVLKGSVRSFSASWDGKEITYGVYGPGTLTGEMSLDGGPRSASVEALEACECAVIDHNLLAAHLREHPEFALPLIRHVIHRARQATESARRMALLDVYGRLRLFLETAPADDDGEFRLLHGRHTQKDIAHRLGSSREMISRIFSDLEAGGHLMVTGGVIRVRVKLPQKW